MYDYGTSCFPKLLDNESAPVKNKYESLKQEKLALAKAKSKKFQGELSAKLLHLNLIHYYSSSIDHLGDTNNEVKKLHAAKKI